MRRIEQLSLGWQTDLIFARFDAQVIEQPDHLVVRTPHNPTFWWGNFLLFDRAPHDGEAARWCALFDAEIAQSQPQSRHLAFGIDTPGDLHLPADFATLGLQCHASTVLTLRRAQLSAAPPALPAGLEMRALRWPDDVSSAIDEQVAADEGDLEPVAYRVFRERQMRRYGAMRAAGRGDWFGVFAATTAGEQMVAGCGLFRDAPHAGTLGRFQYVSTHPAWRRRGLCRALVHAVCRHAFEAMRLAQCVILADPHDVAIGLYESLGFERGTRSWQLERRPPEDQRPACAG